MLKYKSSPVRVLTYGEWIEVSKVGNVCCSVFFTDTMKFNSFPLIHLKCERNSSLLIGKLRGEIRLY